jgi:hypothetical protein
MLLLLVLVGTCFGAIGPKWGNFCGMGHTSAFSVAPIDALDAACKQHDMCYKTNGYSMCHCDAALRSAISGPGIFFFFSFFFFLFVAHCFQFAIEAPRRSDASSFWVL